MSDHIEPQEIIPWGSSLHYSSELQNSTATWIEIKKNTLLSNIALTKKYIGSASLMAVVKGNAYGHDLTLIGSLYNNIPEIAWLCTALLSEALILRKTGTTKPILIMGFIDGSIEDLIRHNIDCTLWSLEQAYELHRIAEQFKKPLYVHIKIDTGLGRLGIIPNDLSLLIDQIRLLPYLIIRGIFTHFSESNAPDTSYTEEQIRLFEHALSICYQKKIHIELVHAANSAGYMRFPHAHYNGIRSAASLFGIAETQHIGMQPVLEWKTRIAALRNISADQAISYARTYTTSSLTRIAILPIGYADGYDRKLSNQGIVYIQEKPCPIIGRICMNITLADVTHLPSVNIHDEVLLIGNKIGCRLDDIATKIGSLNREIVTRINPTIKRILR